MIKLRKTAIGKCSTVVSGGVGVIVSLVVSAVLTAGLAGLLINGKFGEDLIGAAIAVVRAVAIFTGGLAAAALAKEKYLPLIGSIAAIYLLTLLGMGIAFFDGSFQGFGSGIMSVLIGGALACLIKLKPQRKRRSAARYSR